jgi:DNA repair protein RecO (recombination protein O)
MAGSAAAHRNRVDLTPAWLLHTYPYKETSLILEVFSRDHGRVAMVARGARRPASSLRGNLLAFQPLQLSWFGGGELKTLHAVEWQGGVPQLSGLPLICAFYLNELLLRLLPREDEHAGLFDAYDFAIRELVAFPDRVEPILRRFELTLVAQLGYGLSLRYDERGQVVQEGRSYRYVHGKGLQCIEQPDHDDSLVMSGEALLAMGNNDYEAPQTLLQAKLLMRTLLGALLGDAPLHTRQLLRDLQRI